MADVTMGFPHAAPEDEQTMQAFIRSQMYSIMHPVAEHVREVQAQVQQLAKKVTATDGKIDESKVCMEQQHDEFLSLRKSLSQHDTSLERLQDGQDVANREKERLGVDHETTKTDLAKMAAELRSTNASLKAVQQKTEDLSSDVIALHAGAEKMGRTFALEAEKIATTMEMANSLHAQHADALQRMAQLARSGVENNRGLQKLAQQCEKANSTVTAKIERLQEHTDSLEGRLGSTQEDLKVDKETIRNIEEKLRLLKASLETEDAGLEGGSSGAGRFDRDTAEALERLGSTVEGQKVGLRKLQELLNEYKEDSMRQFKDIDHRLGEEIGRVEGLLQTSKEHTSSLLKKHDITLHKVQRHLDAMGGQMDMMQQDLKTVQGGQDDLTSKVEGQRNALSKTQADLKQTVGLVDHAHENLIHLKGGLAAVDATVSKLGTRYDSCTRNVSSVGRGLADVGRHVAQGDHGMLPPRSPHKSPHMRRLPTLHLNNTGGSIDGVPQSAR